MATDSQPGDNGDNNIQVFIRIRPPDTDEPASHIVEVDESHTQIILQQTPTPKTFSFDYVADASATQESIFNRLGKKVIENCISGYNGTIFAYGQTGSGKTFTMLGPSEESENIQSEFRGVIPRTFEYLYSLVNRQKEMHGDDKQFLCKCSFLEIYNEQIFDLLEPSSASLQLRESLKTGVYVAGLSERVVSDAHEAFEVLNNSWMNRRVGATSMNRESSRSHAVFTLQIESKQKKGGIENIKTSQLHLVDLAGSERQKDTGASGQRLKEAGAINKSLSNLGNVIMSLVSESKDGKKRYIPYRDSKLTFLLRDSLGGNSKTSLIACIHGGHRCIGETLSTLQFAKRAKMIKNKAIKNENAQGNVKELQAVIRVLKEELRQYQNDSTPREITVAIPDEAAHVLKKMFLQAMMLQQKTEMDKNELLNTVKQLKDTCDKKDKALLSNRMIIKFRDNTIKQLDSKLKGTETADTQVTNLQQEIEQLRKQLEHNPDATRYLREIKQLKSSLRALKSESGTLAKVNEDRQVVEELETKYKELIAEQECQGPEDYVTPQKIDSVSKATVEKLRSQVADLEGEIEEIKQKFVDAQQAAEKNERMVSSELESKKGEIQELEAYIEANKMKNQLEKAALNEQHLKTVMTITTPKKEKYRLRSRTVLGSTDTPDLNDTIPFEDGTEEEGILGESEPEGFLQQDTEALLEELKSEQEKNARLENTLSTYESDVRKLSTQKTTLENQMAQLEELLEKEKRESSTLREETAKVESQLKDANVNEVAARSEVQDLRLILNASDKGLKETKAKLGELEAMKKEVKEKLESRLSEVEVVLQGVLKTKDRLEEENETMRMQFEEEAENRELQDNVIKTLDKEKNDAKRDIEELEKKLQNAEFALMEAMDSRESWINQLNSEGIEKDNALVLQLEKNKSLQSEFDKLESMFVESKKSEATLKQDIQERDNKLTTMEKNLRQTEEKVSQQYNELQENSNNVTELRQTLQSTIEQLDYCEKAEEESCAFIESLKQKIEEKDETANQLRLDMDKKEEDIKSLQGHLEDFTREYEKQQQQLVSSQAEGEALKKEIEKLQEMLKSKEQTTAELSSKEMQLSCLTDKLDQLEQQRIQKNQDNVHLKEQLREAETNKDILKAELESLQLSHKETLSCLEVVKEEASASNAKSRISEEKHSQAAAEAIQWMFKSNKNETEVNKLKRENEELEKNKTRLMELAKDDEAEKLRLSDEKLQISNELQALKSAVKQISILYADCSNPDTCGIDHIIKSIKIQKDENKKLTEENNQLIGHNNPNQRIKYHETLKLENSQLKRDIKSLVAKCTLLQEELNTNKEQSNKVKLGHPKPTGMLKENTDPRHVEFLSDDMK